MSIDKKTTTKVFLFFSGAVFVFFLYYFVFFLPNRNSIWTTLYAQNKTALIIASIEDYKKNKGFLPDQLSQIKETINKYLSSHAYFAERFLSSPWTKKEIPLFIMPSLGKGWTIKYNELNYIKDGDEYYMYFWLRDSQNRPLSLKEIKDILSRYGDFCPEFSGLIVVHNGKIVFGIVSKNIKPLTFDNLNDYLKPAIRRN